MPYKTYFYYSGKWVKVNRLPLDHSKQIGDIRAEIA